MGAFHGGGARGARVLVVDDEGPLRALFARCLTDAGFAVRSAASVDEAEACVADAPPDALVLDVRLGDCSGVDLAAGLRALHGGSLPVVWVTGAPESVEWTLGPVDVLLAKPFRLADLVRAVNRVLDAAPSAVSVRAV